MGFFANTCNLVYAPSAE